MAASRKRKRRITVDEREYLWWVVEDHEPPVPSTGHSLKLVDVTGQLFIEYHLGQPADVCLVVVHGPRFRSVAGCGGPQRRFRCPPFAPDGVVTPAEVAALIRWLELPDAPAEVDFRGALTSQ